MKENNKKWEELKGNKGNWKDWKRNAGRCRKCDRQYFPVFRGNYLDDYPDEEMDFSLSRWKRYEVHSSSS